MYLKEKKTSGHLWLVSTIVLIIAVIGLVTYIVIDNQNQDNSSEVTTEDSNSQPVQPSNNGTVAIFGSSEPQPVVQGATRNDGVADATIVLTFPEGWSLEGTESKVDPCGGSKTWKISVYRKDTVTITIYENGNPNECGGNQIADVYLDYDFASNDSKIEIDTAIVEFCTKEDNPTCPKGDGNVSLYVGNQTTDGKEEINTLTQSSYFFNINDSRVQPDVDKQVRDLAILLQSAVAFL